MKSFFKKTAISIAVLGLSSAAFAEGTPVKNPMVKPGMMGYFVGVEGLYFEPRNGDLDYVTTYPNVSGGSVNTKAISPSYDWGFRLFGGLRFGDNDDASLAWTHFHTDDNSSVGNPVLADGVTPASSTPRWLDYGLWQGINTSVNFDLDDVTLVMGHTVKFNNPWSVRFAGGLEYARLDSDMTVNASSGLFDIVHNTYPGYSYEATNETRGFGPRVEFDAIYNLTDNFSLFANTSAALLIGTRDIGLNASNPVDSSFLYESTTYSDRHVVIPKLGMRLGVNYAYMMGQAGGEGACSVLNFDAGWEAQTYVHAIERPESGVANYNFTSELVSPPSASSYSASTKTSNYSVQGLFLGINYSWM